MISLHKSFNSKNMITTILIIVGILILVFLIRAGKGENQENSGEKEQDAMTTVYQTVFPNGEKDIEEGANELLQILDNSIDLQTAQSIFLKSSCMCYASTLKGGDFTKEMLMEHLSSYALNYFDEQSLTQFYEYICEQNNNRTDVDNLDEFMSEFSDLSTLSVTDEGELAKGHGEFGLEVTNPVPVNSISDGYQYLDHLRTQDDSAVTYDRIGSVQAPNINELIDAYDIYLDEKKITTIYICPYGDQTSTKAPQGFILN